MSREEPPSTVACESMNRVAIITGASEGLGRVFAHELARLGYDTLSIARNEARLEELISELPHGNHSYHVADLSTQEGIDSCVALMRTHRCHALINNAGFSRFGEFGEEPFADEYKILQVNCHALMAMAYAFLKQAQEGDALINLSSISAYMPTPIQPTYCATKAFIASLSESLWYQERKRGVYVQGLLPGITKTKFIERAGALEGYRKKLVDFISHTPEHVVSASLKAMHKRKKPIVIPGLGSKLTALLARLIPRRTLVWFSGLLGDLA